MAKRRTWTCRGCGKKWHGTKQKCVCGRSRPVKRAPAHQLVLEIPYEDWVARYGARCNICGRPAGPKRNLDRDHDHRTGRPRGVLCPACNRTLGFVERMCKLSTLKWLRAAITYLERDKITLDKAA